MDIQSKERAIKASKRSELKEVQIFQYSWDVALGVQVTGGEDGRQVRSLQARREGGEGLKV